MSNLIRYAGGIGREMSVKMDLGTEKARAKAAEKPLISVSLITNAYNYVTCDV